MWGSTRLITNKLVRDSVRIIDDPSWIPVHDAWTSLKPHHPSPDAAARDQLVEPLGPSTLCVVSDRYRAAYLLLTVVADVL